MRAADKHLTPQELQGLLFSPADSNVTAANRDEMREAQQHLDGCDVCQGMAKKYAKVDSALRALGHRDRSQNRPPSQTTEASRSPASNCPPAETWFRLAAGLIDEAAASQYVSHAAQCDWCGPLLQEAMEDLAQDVTVEEQAAIGKLASAGPGWQRELSKKLAAESGNTNIAPATKDEKPAKSKEKAGFGWWPRFAFAAAGVVAVIAAGWLVWEKLNPDPNKLLAEAYTEHRTIELRMAGAAYGPMRVERGGGHQNMPTQLLEAEAILARKATTHSEDSAWLQAQARAALLEWDYDAAIKKLDDALLLKPDDPGLLLDKATALFERATSSGSSAAIDYGEAAEDLSLVLKKNPKDPVALFNRAIIYEKLLLPDKAIEDCKRYLSLYPSGPWADEMRQLQSRLVGLVKAHDDTLAQPLADPARFVLLARDPADLSHLDERIEDYQDLALGAWLPVAFGDEQGSRDAMAALQALANLLATRHNDRWLNDLLAKADRSPYSLSAIAALSDVVRKSAAGNADSAYAQAQRARALFSKANNIAGRHRAEMEEVHALQRSQRHDLCLTKAALALAGHRRLDYVWIDAQLGVDRAACAFSLAHFADGRSYIAVAEKQAVLGHLPFLGLRAIGIASLADYFEGDQTAAWTSNEKGLAGFWQQNAAPPVRAHQFYDALCHAAEELGYLNLAVALAQESVRTVSLSGNRNVELLTRQHLVELAVRAGQLELARAELKKAADLSAPQGAAQGSSRFYSETTLAEIDMRQGLIGEAEARLKSIEPVLPSMTALAPVLRFHKVKAELDEIKGRSSETENQLLAAVTEVEHSQSHLKTAGERESWKRENADVYRELVSVQIARGEGARALDTWELYLSGGLSPSGSLDAPVGLPDSGIYESETSPLDRTLLSYALLREGLAIWVADGRGVSLRFLRIDTDNVRKQVASFSEMCADPRSDTQVLKSQAKRLFDIFVRPVLDRLPSGRTLVVELDELVSDLPFQALVGPDGSYLTQGYTIVFSPGMQYERALRRPLPISSQTLALVAASTATVEKDGALSLVDQDAMAEASEVAGEFVAARVLSPEKTTAEQIEENISRSELFHFVGHALSSPTAEGLLVKTSSHGTTLWGGRNLPPEIFKNVQFAFLSACSTGRTLRSRREVHGGTVRAMLAAGVPNVVASKWDVDSGVTRRLARAFYAAALAGGSVPAALRKAELQIMEGPGTAHPYYWAAFGAFGHA